MAALLLPLIATVTDAFSFILGKVFLRRFGRLTYKEFNWLIFLGIVVVLVISAQIFDQFPEWSAMKAHWVPLLALSLLGAFGNIFFSYALESEKVATIEPFVVFRPLAVILIASLFYPEERNLVTYLAVAAAAAILAWANLRHKKITLSRGLWFVILQWVIAGIDTILVVELLPFFSPVALYMARCVIVFIALTLISRPNFKYMQAQHLPFAFASGVLAVITVVATYRALSSIGISATLFFLMLAPGLVYWFSGIFLHERWEKKNLVATGLILLLVVATSWYLAQ